MAKKIYLASPFFNPMELLTYQDAIKSLREAGYEVYAPQEHKIEGAWEMANHAWGRAVFFEDLQAIVDCDAMLILNWGMYSDSGTAWEAGFAYCNKIPTIQVLCGEPNTTYSLMMINGADKVVHFTHIENWEEKSAEVELSTIIQK